MKKTDKIRVATIILIALCVSPAAGAQVSDQAKASSDLDFQLQEMRSQLAKMQNRIAALEAAKKVQRRMQGPVQPLRARLLRCLVKNQVLMPHAEIL